MAITNILFRRSVLLCLLGGSVLLSGCETLKRPLIGKPQVVQEPPEQSQAEREAAQLAQCQKELDALHPVDANRYQDYKQEFNRLMNGAAQYAGVRTRVSAGTQETVDALYRYKVKRLCADISQALLTGLSDMGDRVK